jgi:hypothetical protein
VRWSNAMRRPVERSYIDFSVVEGDSAIHDIATKEVGSLARHPRIVGPFHFSRSRVEGEHYAPGTSCKDGPISDNRRGFEPARRPQFLTPH